MSWLCKFCQVWSANRANYCRVCRGHWKEVSWEEDDQRPHRYVQPAKRRRSKSKSKSETKTSDGVNKHQNSRDPLRPFAVKTQPQAKQGAAASSAGPWKASTPTRRLATPAPPDHGESGNGEASKEEDEENKEDMGADALKHLQALKDILGKDLPEDMAKAVEKSLGKGQEAEAELNPSLIFRIKTCRKAAAKAKERLEQVDQEWSTFQKVVAARIKEQKESYVIERGQAQQAYQEKIAKLQEAQEELRTKAGAASAMPEAEIYTKEELDNIMNNMDLEDVLTVDSDEETKIPEKPFVHLPTPFPKPGGKRKGADGEDDKEPKRGKTPGE